MSRSNPNVCTRRGLLLLASCSLLALAPGTALAGKGSWSVGISLGAPYPRPCCGPYYRPWYYPYPYYRPVYVAPPPVIVQPAPIVQTVPAPVYQLPAPSVAPYQAPAPTPQYQAPAPTPLPTQTSANTVAASSNIDHHLNMLRQSDERLRIDSVMHLGRSRSLRAVDPLAATLAGDQSPSVREAAARALGLLGSTNALPALQHAAQADSDRDVRRSAQFAVEVIQSRQ